MINEGRHLFYFIPIILCHDAHSHDDLIDYGTMTLFLHRFSTNPIPKS